LISQKYQQSGQWIPAEVSSVDQQGCHLGAAPATAGTG